MKLDFTQVVLEGVDGIPLKHSLHKDIGNFLYMHTRDIGTRELAKKIYAGEEVEVTPEQKAEILGVVNDPQSKFFGFVIEAVTNYIKSQQDV